MKNNKSISRSEALKKMGKYSALTALTTFAILSPAHAQSGSGEGSGGNLPGGENGDRPGSLWK